MMGGAGGGTSLYFKTLGDAHREECSFLSCFTFTKVYPHFKLNCLQITELLTCQQVLLWKLSCLSGKMTVTRKTWEEPQRTLKKFNRTVFLLLLLQSVSMCGGALFMILINKSQSFSQALFCMMMAMSLNALGNSGVAVTPQDMSPKFAGTLFGKIRILFTGLEFVLLNFYYWSLTLCLLLVLGIMNSAGAFSGGFS